MKTTLIIFLNNIKDFVCIILFEIFSKINKKIIIFNLKKYKYGFFVYV